MGPYVLPIIGVICTLLLLSVVVWKGSLGRLWEFRRRRLLEDALKHLLACAHARRDATTDSLAGVLGVRPKSLYRLITRMEVMGLLHSQGGSLELTQAGERWALNVVRAHRIWERYLSDEANVPLAELHHYAESAEHHLQREEVDALDAHLGYPPTDPHGDPIPTSEGAIDAPRHTPLTDWPVDQPARISHIEDEPEVLCRQIVAEGLRPGMVLRVRERNSERLLLDDDSESYRLSPAIAAMVHVERSTDARVSADDTMTLAEAPDGADLEVVQIDSRCRGLNRRRLLDLGLTCGATIRPHLRSIFGDTRAYVLRGATIALRREQAELIRVRPHA